MKEDLSPDEDNPKMEYAVCPLKGPVKGTNIEILCI